MTALFQADIFSVSQPEFSQVRPEVDGIVREVSRVQFASAVRDLREVSQFGGNEISSNNFRLTTAESSFLLKRLPGAADTTTLLRQLALLPWLRASGVAVPRVVTSDRGTPLVTEAGVHWCLFDFVKGGFFAGGERELISTGLGIGRLQHALADLPETLAPGTKWDYATRDDAEVFASVRDRHAQLESIFGAESGRLLLEHWPRVLTVAEELERRRGEVASEVLGTCHADLHPHNVLMMGGELAAFVDFEALIRMPICASVGYAGYKLLKQHAVSRHFSAADAVAIHGATRTFVASIADQAVGLDADLEALRLMALSELFRRLLVVFRLNLVDRNTAWNHVLPMHLAGLAEIDIIFRGNL